jgi:integrase
MRWGEHAALRANRAHPDYRRLTIDRQLIETTTGKLKLSLPKNRGRRATVYPARTPLGVDLAALVARRVDELEPNQLLPLPPGRWARRSNYSRNTWNPAAHKVAWPQQPDGTWTWTYHHLRHVFATWALNKGTPIEDLSRFLGHADTRNTQDIYIHIHGNHHTRFHQATK